MNGMDGGTALKPSFEPIIVARKPFKGSLVDNVIQYGVGGINIDECRVENSNNEKLTRNLYNNPSWKNSSIAGQGSINDTSDRLGRFPANTILTYDETDFDEVCGGFPNTKSQIGARGGQGFHNCLGRPNRERKDGNNLSGYNDSGSASRYFMNCKYTGKDEEIKRYIYTPKASKRDRDEGLDTFNQEKVNDGRQTPIDNPFQRGETPRRNVHPCVKPTELMQYLVRLVTPNDGTILDPFNGSGSTGKAVMYENKDRNKNYKYIGIELSEEYLEISKARINFALEQNEEQKKEEEDQISLWQD
jgi:site-specific DNA-methyltransferase (adenine-specific)